MALSKQQLAEACAEAMWADDKASQGLGMVIENVTPGRSELSMTVREDMVNGHSICHGGFIFTLADSAFAFACNSENFNTVAAGVRIEFLAPAKLGDRLSALAKQVHQGRRTGVYDVLVTNQDGRKLAVFRGNSHRISGALVDEETGESQL
jgi:acyl-CoA thioesterase